MKAKDLKKQLSIDNYRQIFQALGAEWKETNNEYWQLLTGCHNLDWHEGSYKLYFYLNTHSFFCFTSCSASFDIFELVRKRWELEERVFTFRDIVAWVCGIIGISPEENAPDSKVNRQQWKSCLERYTEHKSPIYEGKIYDKSVLNLFLPYYHHSFLNDNITIEIMRKWNIGYYPPTQQITIPVFDNNGNLIGIHCRNLNKRTVEKGYKYMPFKTVNNIEYKFKTNQALYGLNINKPMIEYTRRCLLFESPKSVLQMESYFGRSNAVALFGMNLNPLRRNMILECGVDEIVICLDKQYRDTEGNEWEQYCQNVSKIAKLFKGYCKVSVIVDFNNRLEYKDSPSDKGKDVWIELFRERVEVEI